MLYRFDHDVLSTVTKGRPKQISERARNILRGMDRKLQAYNIAPTMDFQRRVVWKKIYLLKTHQTDSFVCLIGCWCRSYEWKIRQEASHFTEFLEIKCSRQKTWYVHWKADEMPVCWLRPNFFILDLRRVGFSYHHHIMTTPSLPRHHYHPIIINPSLPPPSLPPPLLPSHQYHPIITTTSLLPHHPQLIITTTSLPPHHYHHIITTSSLPPYYYHHPA